jgi:hypothetical protein
MESAQAIGISEVGPEELDDLAAFLQEESSRLIGDLPASTVDAAHLRWFLFDHPVRSSDLPAGWAARDARGRIVGAAVGVPQRFSCRDRQFVCIVCSAYYVARSHRGIGLALLQRYLRLSKRYALMTTTSNATSQAVFERLGSYPIPNTDHELLGILRWTPVIEEWLHGRLRRPRAARLLAGVGALGPARLGRDARGGTLTRVRDPGELERAPVTPGPEHRDQLTAVRDPAFLEWRYFAGPDPTRALYLFRADGGARCWVGVNLRRRGYRGQIRALNVLDLWGAIPEPCVAVVARQLASCYGDEVDLIVFRGQPAARQGLLRRAGFLYRAFAQPIGHCLDRAHLLPTRDWYLVPADGDMGV